MAAWSPQLHSIASRPERAVRDLVESSTVKAYECRDATSPLSVIKKMSDTAQVTFAFFAD
jgi:hypothetical protein